MYKKELDSYYYHEALDRAYMFLTIIHENLTKHPVLKSHKILRKKMKKVEKHLAEIYQIIGGMGWNLYPEVLPEDAEPLISTEPSNNQ